MIQIERFPSLKRIAQWLCIVVIISFLLGGVGLWADRGHRGGMPPEPGYPLHISKENATTADISLMLHTGDIDLTTGGPDLIWMIIASGPLYQPPQQRYTVKNGTGVLRIVQDEVSPLDPLDYGERWGSSISPDIPTNLSMKVGTGNTRIIYAGDNLTQFSLDTGVGDSTIDLTGWSGERLTLSVTIGVGDLSIKLPESISCSATIDQGLGDHTISGFDADGDQYHHQGINNTEKMIQVKVKQGVGDLKIRTETRK